LASRALISPGLSLSLSLQYPAYAASIYVIIIRKFLRLLHGLACDGQNVYQIFAELVS